VAATAAAAVVVMAAVVVVVAAAINCLKAGRSRPLLAGTGEAGKATSP
jgi:hypothetical protein